MKVLVIFLLLTAVVAASPEINIDVDTLHFGYISAGGENQRTFRIGNAGDENLMITDLECPDFSFSLINPALPVTITPNSLVLFRIRFSPIDAISYDCVFTITSNDPTNPTRALPATAAGAPAFEPGEIIWSYQCIENVVCCTAFDDLNGDGFPEVVAEAFDAGAQGDNLICLSGSGNLDGQLLWSARPVGGPSSSGGYGDDCLTAIDDINGNGIGDLLLGTAWGSRSIFSIDGATGETIWTYDTYEHPPSGWIYSVNTLGDLNGDNIPEVIAGAGSESNAGYCLDGATGDLIWRKQAGDVIYTTVAIDDVNDDNYPDAILGGGDAGEDRVYCISGASQGYPLVLWAHPTGASVWSVDRISDINNDGYNDVVAGTWYNGNMIMALSGHSSGNGQVLWSTSVGYAIMKIVVCEDLNNDGLEDVLVASWGNFVAALSGADGSELWTYYTGDDVWAVYWAFDVTGDGIKEVVAGCFNGSVYLINGASGGLVWECPTDAKIFTVRPIKDVNGDGFDDIIAGQQMLYSGGGKLFVISGGTVQQTPIDDDIENGRVPERFFSLANYPNPFNATTAITYSLPISTDVRVSIYDLTGRLVRTLISEYQEAGEHQAIWNGFDSRGEETASGVYFYSISADGRGETKRMTLLK